MERRTIGIREETPEEKAQRNTETLADIEAYFKESLRFAEGVLTVDYLTGEDRGAIEDAIHGIKHWLPIFLKSDEVTFVRQAGLRLAVYNSMIGARCEVSDSEAEYWRRQRCAKGGKGEKEKRKKNQAATEAWRSYARTLEGAKTETTLTALAESLLIDRERPVATPSNLQTLQKFLGKARRERLAAGKAPLIRLIHSA